MKHQVIEKEQEKQRKGETKHKRASCRLEVLAVCKNKTGRQPIEQIQEEQSENAGQEAVDELWKELALDMEKRHSEQVVKRSARKRAFIGRGGQPNWIEDQVTEKGTKTKKRSIWRRAHVHFPGNEQKISRAVE